MTMRPALGCSLSVAPPRQAAWSCETEMRRVHRRQRSARIHEFELAAQRRIGGDAAVVDVVDSRPVGAGVRVEFVAVAAAVEVGPHVGAPCPGSAARAIADIALAVRRHPVGEVATDGQQLDGRGAAPAIHILARLPAAQVGMLRAGLALLAFLDRLAQIGVERDRIRHLEGNERRGEKQGNLGRDAQVLSLIATGTRGILGDYRSTTRRTRIAMLDTGRL